MKSCSVNSCMKKMETKFVFVWKTTATVAVAVAVDGYHPPSPYTPAPTSMGMEMEASGGEIRSQVDEALQLSIS